MIDSDTTDMVGKLVHCFQPFNSLPQPFTAKIKADYGNHWELTYKRKVYKALKAACSTVPFAKDEDTQGEEYRDKVKAVATVGRPEPTDKEPQRTTKKLLKKVVKKSTAAVEPSEKDDSSHRSTSENPRFQRPRNGKNTGPSGSIRKTPKKGKSSRFSRSS